jgi:hypothetical protein
VRQPQYYSVSENGWHHVSSHGTVLFCIAANQACTINDLSVTLFLTRRTVWGIVAGLRRTGMLHVRKSGRSLRYSVNLDAPFRHPVLKGITLRHVLGKIVEMAQGDPTIRLAKPR